MGTLWVIFESLVQCGNPMRAILFQDVSGPVSAAVAESSHSDNCLQRLACHSCFSAKDGIPNQASPQERH